VSNTRPVRRVRVGAYVDPVAPLRAVNANIALAKLMRVDDVWFGDHTVAMLPESVWDPATNPLARIVPDLDAYFDPTAVIARYASRYRMPMGTSVTDAVRRTPADLARAWATLSHVTGGRAILGIGSGESENTEPYGQSMARSVTRLEDTLEALRAAWDSEGRPVDHEGAFHTWRHAKFALRGWADRPPPVWVAAQGPRACAIAGRLGDGWIHVHEGLERWQEASILVSKSAREAGRDPASLERSLVIAGLLLGRPGDYDKACAAPTMRAAALALRASAWADAGAEHPLGADFGGFSSHDPSLLTAERMADAGAAVTPQLLRKLMPCGSAAEVRRYLAPFVTDGLTHVLVINLAPTCGIGVGVRSMREQSTLTHLLKAMRPGLPA
jgi:phthiodiolone/phenolphthiodiolone dimycocerosates ketoreductase